MPGFFLVRRRVGNISFNNENNEVRLTHPQAVSGMVVVTGMWSIAGVVTLKSLPPADTP